MKKLFFPIYSIIFLIGCQNSTEQTSEDSTNETENNDVEHVDTINHLSEIENASSDWFQFEESGFHTGFDFRVYISDPDAEGPTNVRDNPNGKIIEKLSHDDDYMLNIIDQKDGWYQFNDLVSFNEMEYVTDGWIHHSVIGLSNRMCDNNKCPMYKYPMAEDSLLIMNLPMEVSLRPNRLYQEFVEVTYVNDKGKSFTGWIHQDCTCGNPVTTCP